MTENIKKYILGYDSFERHHVVSKLVSKKSKNILDVGGGERLLQKFTDIPILSVNLGQGDIRANGLNLPFSNKSFDTVTSLDVLEHIPSNMRCQFLNELLRVSCHQVVLCAPYGSQAHMESEVQILERMRQHGITNKMLEEHVANGLPTVESILSCIPEDISLQASFSGFFQFNNICFWIDNIFGAEKLKFLKIVIGLFLNLIGNTIIQPISFSKTSTASTNRMFIEINK